MTEKELQTYLQKRFPCENEACDWKEFKSLKNCFNGKEGAELCNQGKTRTASGTFDGTAKSPDNSYLKSP